jgi:hypothetical protein
MAIPRLFLAEGMGVIEALTSNRHLLLDNKPQYK